ncbi:MAG: tetratricopeptide repeat protein [Desulfohalobiaceae bacterium]|nr:tetratricopeptide repeat protein [Desulfohalobiaceae bacterium]
MGKNKGQDLESILARAEKFWQRGNYLLAEKEYAKALKKGCQGDVSRKIAVCRQEIAKQKSKELSKKGKTQLRKENYQAALDLFAEAHKLEPQAWLEDKVNELQKLVQAGNALDLARKAEAQGKYQQAADLYAQAAKGDEQSPDIALQEAACLVKSGDFEAAVLIYADLEPASNKDLYNQGFALIKTGRLFEGLCAWERMQQGEIPANHWQQFQDQLFTVRTGLAGELVGSIGDGAYQEDAASLYDQLNSLLKHFQEGQTREDLLRCQQILIKDLWAQERYEDIERLLEPPSGSLDLKQVGPWAKLYFKLAESTGSHLEELRMFWLTAVYDFRLIAGLAPESETEKLQARLIHMAEEVIKKAGNKDKQADISARTRWNTDKALLGRLSACKGKSKDGSLVLCTPELASRLGCSRELLDLIRANKASFPSEGEYLQAGGYYSAAGRSQYLLDEGDCPQALNHLPRGAWEEDEFTRYVALKVYFFYGLHCLETGQDKAERYLKDIDRLFDLAPEYEKRLLEHASRASEGSLETMQRYEIGLQKIYAQNPSQAVAQRLSLIMSRRAVLSYNQDQIADAALASQLNQALSYDPDNEYALENLRQTWIDLEFEKMDRAVDQGKLKKAGNLAAKSEYLEVKERFFEIAKEMLEDVAELKGKERLWKKPFLGELLTSCRRADPSHPLIAEIMQSLSGL